MTIGTPANDSFAPVTIVNEAGSGPFVLVCDHASNFMPAPYGDLGLSADDLKAHIAWDPGALGVSMGLSRLLDAPLVHSNVSRLIIDCNRVTDAPDLIPSRSELTDVPGNKDISATERRHRIALSHTPFHSAIDKIIDARVAKKKLTAVVSIHSYTPVYKGTERPWEIGLIYGDDASLAAPTLEALRKNTSYQVGDNEPYSPADGVYYTLNRHGSERGLKSLMIEIRNDEIADPASETAWAELLAPVLTNALAEAGGADA
ncbi:N-formylglutamate amidohydrolase [Roseibium sp.]|uniref:N-formylglutamate amidohydrolase n=1 Tax=Roseibium sp. TaxID=1936156 RepID=UPI003A975748